MPKQVLQVLTRLSFEVVVAFLFALIALAVCSLVAYGSDDEGWLAGAIQSEAYSQPFPAQCAIGTIVWKEAQRRHITVEELATNTNFLSGWRYGGAWHRQQYLNPESRFRLIAQYSEAGACDDYGARYFDGRYRITSYIPNAEGYTPRSIETYKYACRPHPAWSERIRLIIEIGGTCFYG